MFPIQFMQPNGNRDFISPIVNFSGNAMVVAGVVLGAGAITCLAMKALGYSSYAILASASISLGISSAAFLCACAGVYIIGALALTALRKSGWI